MEDVLIQSPKKITSKYIFKADIEKVWALIMDHEFSSKILIGDQVVSLTFTKENKFDQLGSEYKIHCQNYTLFFKCLNLMREANYKSITFNVFSDKKEYFFNYDYTYTLISNTMDGTTIFIWDMIIEYPVSPQMSLSALEEYKQYRLVCLNRWSHYLIRNEKEFSQYESILIHAERNQTWNIITNWSLLRTIAPYIADEVEYNGDNLTEGSSLILKYNSPKKKIVCDFKISKVYKHVSSDDWQYFLELQYSFPKIPNQEIKLSIIFLQSDKCFLNFEHLYKERLDNKMLSNISSEKKKLLKDIKNYLEK